MLLTAADGSSASVIGRPMTRIEAPASIAARGVTTRFWSPRRRPAGRTPGTTKKPSGHALWAARTSSPEQTMPSRPALWASAARRAHLVGRAALDAGRGEILFVEAGQDGDRDDLRLGRRRRLGIFEHRPPAGGVDGQDRRLERRQRLHRLGDRIGDVVELQIEEDRQAELAELGDPRRAVGGEEFQPELEPAGDASDGSRDVAGPGQIGRVDRDENRAHMAEAASSVCAGSRGESPAAAARLRRRRFRVHSRAR